MYIKQLKAVLAVAETLSFSEAAYDTSFSTSAISRQVIAMEDELGVRLFDRKGKMRVSVTPEGQKLLPYMHGIVEENERMLRAARQMRERSGMRLSIALPPNAQSTIEISLVYELMRVCPGIDIVEHKQSDERCVELVTSGRVDVGLASLLGTLEDNPVFLECAQNEAVTSYPIAACKSHVLLNRSHQLASRESLRLSDFRRFPDMEFVFASAMSEIAERSERIFLACCESMGYAPKTRMLSPQVGVIPEILSRYVDENPNTAAFVFDILPRRNNCVKCSLDEEMLQYIVFIYYLRENDSRAIKLLKKCAGTVAGPTAGKGAEKGARQINGG